VSCEGRGARVGKTGGESRKPCIIPSNVSIAHKDSCHRECGCNGRLKLAGVAFGDRLLIGDYCLIEDGRLG